MVRKARTATRLDLYSFFELFAGMKVRPLYIFRSCYGGRIYKGKDISDLLFVYMNKDGYSYSTNGVV